MEIGQRIKTAREKIGWSQRELGEKVGKDRKTITNYETGVTDPPAGVLVAMSRAIGVSPRWLLTGEEEGEASRVAEGTAEYGLSAQQKELLNLFTRLPEKKRALVLELLRNF